jgi:hypothetical protein
MLRVSRDKSILSEELTRWASALPWPCRRSLLPLETYWRTKRRYIFEKNAVTDYLPSSTWMQAHPLPIVRLCRAIGRGVSATSPINNHAISTTDQRMLKAKTKEKTNKTTNVGLKCCGSCQAKSLRPLAIFFGAPGSWIWVQCLGVCEGNIQKEQFPRPPN